MRAEPETSGEGGAPQQWFASAKKIYPMAVRGTFRRIKWALLIITLGIYYFLPFLRWDRGPNAPDQALLIDMARRRAYFFNIEIWPQEVYYITGLLILAAMVLFLMNAVAGRIWCGYLCPQTVWTDLFLLIERKIEGDRRDRMALDRSPWSIGKLLRRLVKHALWLVIAIGTGGAWVLYFADAPTLLGQIFSLSAPMSAYIWIGILTFTTYSLAGFMREQVCVYMCPWPRIQAALTDEKALNVAYRWDRGEPRGSLKHNLQLKAQGQPAGDCVDCGQCLHVCPTGVDIRKGLQLDCIQCGLGIDACDAVMEKVGKPTGLIAYDTDENIQRRSEGKETRVEIVRPRTIIYVIIIALVTGIMSYALYSRNYSGLSVVHDRNPIFVVQNDGSVRNGYAIRVSNKRTSPRDFVLTVDGMPQGTRIDVIGATLRDDAGAPVVSVGPDQSREMRVLLYAPPNAGLGTSTPITFRIGSTMGEREAETSDYFRGP